MWMLLKTLKGVGGTPNSIDRPSTGSRSWFCIIAIIIVHVAPLSMACQGYRWYHPRKGILRCTTVPWLND